MAEIRVEGVRQTVKALKGLDPAVRKTFNANVKEILSPIVLAAQASYTPGLWPSGTRRRWAPGGRQVFPIDTRKVISGVKPKVSTSKRNSNTISVVQSNPAGAIYEMAGKGGSNALARAFDAHGRVPARVLWPAADRNIDRVQSRMVDYIAQVEDMITKEMSL